MKNCLCCDAIIDKYNRIIVETGFGSYQTIYTSTNINYCPQCGRPFNVMNRNKWELKKEFK